MVDASEKVLSGVITPMQAEQQQAVANGQPAADPKCGNKGMIQEIDNDINSIEATIQILRNRAFQRRKERNSLVQFNTLPLELSAYVLWLSVADPWKRKLSIHFVRRVLITSSVCTLWRTVMEGSPLFWSVIELSEAPRVIKTLLARSKSAPLEIKCFSEGGYNCMQRLDISRPKASPLEPFHPHAARVRSLVLSMPSTNGIMAMISKPAPLIEELKLGFVHCLFVQPLELFCGHAPNLRDVSLENFPVKWDSEVLKGLKTLTIKKLPAYYPTEGEVRKLLCENVGLEKLDLEDVTIGAGFWDEANGSTQRAIHRSGKENRMAMSDLEELRLFNLPFEIAGVVLGVIKTPHLKSLHLSCNFRYQRPSIIQGPDLQPLILGRSTGAQLAEINFGHTTVEVNIYQHISRDPPIRIHLTDTVPLAAFEWMAGTVFQEGGLLAVAAPEFQVSLKFGDKFDMAEDRFLSILDLLVGIKVKTLTIENSCQNGELVIRYLGERRALAGDGSWYLPDMMALTVAGPAMLGPHLLTALEARKQKNTEDDPMETSSPAQETPTSTSPRAPEPIGSMDRSPVELEVLNIEGMKDIDKKVENLLAHCVSKSGTFIKARRRQPTYWSGFGDTWEDEMEGGALGSIQGALASLIHAHATLTGAL